MIENIINENKKPLGLAINWHLWPKCNYRCRFCFATFNDIPKHLDFETANKIPQMLRNAGFDKITFAGGEPTLCSWLEELLDECKNIGFTTSIVTNGSKLSKNWLDAHSWSLDWLGLSIDSNFDGTHAELGRGEPSECGNGESKHIKRCIKIADAVHDLNIGLKVNTVVTSLNWMEDHSELMKRLDPLRWKIFQVLPIFGQNNGRVEELLVTKNQFNKYVNRQKDLVPDIQIVAESNDDMTGSYIMLDPIGRFFHNIPGRHVYGPSCLEVGVKEAFEAIEWSQQKYLDRGGLWNWNRKKVKSDENYRRQGGPL